MFSFTQRPALAECTSEKTAAIQAATGLCGPVAALLCRRGIDTPEAAKRFLHPGPEQFHDPLLLPDMGAAARRIARAVDSREKITVFCDYDADGTTGGCALYLHLKGRGADVTIMTPNRHREGYGLNEAAVAQMADAGCGLVITVDCGITNIGETALARQRGMDVVITDHHECGEALPDTPYIINAKRSDSAYPDANLAGCGVAFKLIHALSSLSEAMRYIDLIAIGTIADIVPLLGENRVIAHMGLNKMRHSASPGVEALAQAAGIPLAEASSFHISFGLGPRINAAGRMDTAEAAIDILKSTKHSAALKQNAERLCALNDARKKDVEEILADAEAMIEQGGYHGDPAILLAGGGWNAGVIGIAAARIAEKYTRPCVLFSGETQLIGSARSVEGVNIHEALGAFADRYLKFGGHAQAAGLTIAPEVLDGLRRDVCAYIGAHYDECAFARQKPYDMALTAGEITRELAEDLARLEPFGAHNEKPVALVTDGALRGARFVGRNEQPHLKFAIEQGGRKLDAVAFYYKDAHALVPGRADMLCEPGIDGMTNAPQVIVRDFKYCQDDALIKSFLNVHADSLMWGFLDEVSALGGQPCGAIDEAAFVRKLNDALGESRFGLCVSVNTVPAFERVLALEPVKRAMRQGVLALWDEKAFSPDNCVACGAAPGHTRRLAAGISEQAAFFDDALRRAYRAHARQVFLSRDELIGVYRALKSMVKRARTVHEIARRLSRPSGAVAFAARVFAELELIGIDKSGKILALYEGRPRKDLRQSRCYANFEDLLNG